MLTRFKIRMWRSLTVVTERFAAVIERLLHRLKKRLANALNAESGSEHYPPPSEPDAEPGEPADNLGNRHQAMTDATVSTDTQHAPHDHVTQSVVDSTGAAAVAQAQFSVESLAKHKPIQYEVEPASLPQPCVQDGRIKSISNPLSVANRGVSTEHPSDDRPTTPVRQSDNECRSRSVAVCHDDGVVNASTTQSTLAPPHAAQAISQQLTESMVQPETRSHASGLEEIQPARHRLTQTGLPKRDRDSPQAGGPHVGIPYNESDSMYLSADDGAFSPATPPWPEPVTARTPVNSVQASNQANVPSRFELDEFAINQDERTNKRNFDSGGRADPWPSLLPTQLSSVLQQHSVQLELEQRLKQVQHLHDMNNEQAGKVWNA